MISVTLDRPWLMARLPARWRVLSHAPYGAGYRLTDQVLWREVKNADLTPDFDVDDWFAAQMQRAPMAVGMMTSRDIGTWDQATATVDGITAQAVVTLGLSNAESVGHRLPWHSTDYGTINLLVATDAPLTETAQLEALTIAVQARTVGVLSAGLALQTGQATGTGNNVSQDRGWRNKRRQQQPGQEQAESGCHCCALRTVLPPARREASDQRR